VAPQLNAQNREGVTGDLIRDVAALETKVLALARKMAALFKLRELLPLRIPLIDRTAHFGAQRGSTPAGLETPAVRRAIAALGR
jgi:hypothetical protein